MFSTLPLILFLTLFRPVPTHQIKCDDQSCYGKYEGSEFVKGSDVAHQFSNHMSWAVGDQLKKLYRQEDYVMVDFDKIEMRTEGMGSGRVRYYLKIPFKRVDSACAAYTSFDHVGGGWNHASALAGRIRQLQKALLPGEELYISELKQTPEGLQEYWIQWRNRRVQAECAD